MLAKERILALNSLRFLGMVGVIGYHMMPFKLKGGYLGVLLFFVLSGFLLAYRNYNFDSFRVVLKFYKHKIERIYPPLIIMVLFTLGILLLLHPEVLPTSKAELFSVFGGYNNIWQVNQGLSYFAKTINLSPFTHIWSLAIEIQFYLLWPIIIFIYQKFDHKKKERLYVTLGICIASLFPMIIMYFFQIELTNIYYGTFTRIGAIFFGVFIGLLKMHFDEIRYRLPFKYNKITVYVILLFTILMYFVMDSQKGYTYVIGIPFCTILFAGLVFLLCHPIFRKTFLASSFFTYMSKISYEMYLWMFPVIYFSSYFGIKTNFLSIVGQLIVICVLSISAHELIGIIGDGIKILIEKKRGTIYE